MLMVNHIPAPPLSRFVEQFCYYSDSPAHKFERVLPTGRLQLIINLYEDRIPAFRNLDPATRHTLPGMLIAGPASHAELIGTDCLRSIITVAFRPGAAFPFMGLPVSELSNADTALSDVWLADSGRLREQLLEAPTAALQFAVLEEYLLARLSRGKHSHPVVDYAVCALDRGGEPTSVASLSSKLGFTSRRFQQIFSEHVGLSPKTFYRVRRFQRIVRTLHRQPEADWASLALACGYYDQSHFNHDFREFSGINPSTYSAANRIHYNHVAVEG